MTLDVYVAVVGDVEDGWGDVLPLVSSTLGLVFAANRVAAVIAEAASGPARDPPGGGTAGRVV